MNASSGSNMEALGLLFIAKESPLLAIDISLALSDAVIAFASQLRRAVAVLITRVHVEQFIPCPGLLAGINRGAYAIEPLARLGKVNFRRDNRKGRHYGLAALPIIAEKLRDRDQLVFVDAFNVIVD
jgi:hypothetical protein